MDIKPVKSILSTEQKALAVNLDAGGYGTIVEIGAGQEVARRFFSVGAAAGTIAKTMSAYDMQFSDQIYGKASRYVSQERVEQMLDHEYDLLVTRLAPSRGETSQFFSYASTVVAQSYEGGHHCHGYIGVRFQRYPQADFSTIYLHVRMMDADNKSQSEALGILGVNVIHGIYHFLDEPKQFIECLLDNLASDRLEIDFIQFTDHGFEQVENRLMNLHLIRSWCTRSVMFDANGQSKVPASVLRKNPIMVIRGSFKPPTKVHVDMFESGVKEFGSRKEVDSGKVVALAEITMVDLGVASPDADDDFLARVDLLNSLGYSVLISDYFRYFRLRSWLRQFTEEPISLTISVLDFDTLFNVDYYDGVEGGILEAMGKLFQDATRIYVYPAMINGELVGLDSVKVKPEQRHLLQYFVDNGLLLDCPYVSEENLSISPGRTADMIAADEEGWQDHVPAIVAKQIIDKRLFRLLN